MHYFSSTSAHCQTAVKEKYETCSLLILLGCAAPDFDFWILVTTPFMSAQWFLNFLIDSFDKKKSNVEV